MGQPLPFPDTSTSGAGGAFTSWPVAARDSTPAVEGNFAAHMAKVKGPEPIRRPPIRVRLKVRSDGYVSLVLATRKWAMSHADPYSEDYEPAL
jgi:hypothetical protein